MRIVVDPAARRGSRPLGPTPSSRPADAVRSGDRAPQGDVPAGGLDLDLRQREAADAVLPRLRRGHPHVSTRLPPPPPRVARGAAPGRSLSRCGPAGASGGGTPARPNPPPETDRVAEPRIPRNGPAPSGERWSGAARSTPRSTCATSSRRATSTRGHGSRSLSQRLPARPPGSTPPSSPPAAGAPSSIRRSC